MTSRHLRSSPSYSNPNSYAEDNPFYLTRNSSSNATDLTVIPFDGTPSTSAPRSHVHSGAKVSNASDNIKLVLEILFIFISSIAIVIAFVLLIHTAAVIFNKYCWSCCGACRDCLDSDYADESQETEGQEDDVDNNTPSSETYGPVAFRAWLWGLTPSERRAVLERAFSKNTTVYEGEEPKDINHASKTMQDQHPISVEKCVDVSLAYNTSTTSKEQVSDTESITEESITSIVVGDSHDGNKQIICGVRVGSAQEAATAEELLDTSIDSNDLDERKMCAICLAGYEDGDKIVCGNCCKHQFHFDCCMEWMKNCHDHCPYCRVEMMTPQDMRRAASDVLERERLAELSWGRWCYAPDMTDSPLSNVSDAFDQNTVLPLSYANGGERNGHPQNQLDTASPAQSDQAQLGQTMLTPLGELCDPKFSLNSAATTGSETRRVNDNVLEPIRQSLDQRLATPEETLMRLPVSTDDKDLPG